MLNKKKSNFLTKLIKYRLSIITVTLINKTKIFIFQQTSKLYLKINNVTQFKLLNTNIFLKLMYCNLDYYFLNRMTFFNFFYF